MSMEVSTYMLAAGLIAGGMNWKQAMGTILLGNLIVLVPMLLNAHAGAKYGIPFPVFVRASLGVRGREYSGDAARDCGVRLVWDSVVDRRDGYCAMVQCWAADRGHGLGDVGVLPRVLAAEYVDGVARRGVDSISAELFCAVHGFMSLTLLIFMLHKAGGFGPMLAAPSKFTNTRGVSACSSFRR